LLDFFQLSFFFLHRSLRPWHSPKLLCRTCAFLLFLRAPPLSLRVVGESVHPAQFGPSEFLLYPPGKDGPSRRTSFEYRVAVFPILSISPSSKKLRVVFLSHGLGRCRRRCSFSPPPPCRCTKTHNDLPDHTWLVVSFFSLPIPLLSRRPAFPPPPGRRICAVEFLVWSLALVVLCQIPVPGLEIVYAMPDETSP